MTSLTLSRKLAVGVLVVLAVSAVAAGAYYTWLITPPGMPETPEAALSVIASARYERLPDYRKREYLDRTAEMMKSMPDEHRRDLFRRMRTDETVRQALREVREDQAVKRIREWANAGPDERRKLIDQMIREQEQMRAEREQERAQRGDEPGGERGSEREGRRESSRDRMHRRIEEGNPQTMAWRMEMRDAINQRRQELGLPEATGLGGRRR